MINVRRVNNRSTFCQNVFSSNILVYICRYVYCVLLEVGMEGKGLCRSVTIHMQLLPVGERPNFHWNLIRFRKVIAGVLFISRAWCIWSYSVCTLCAMTWWITTYEAVCHLCTIQHVCVSIIWAHLFVSMDLESTNAIALSHVPEFNITSRGMPRPGLTWKIQRSISNVLLFVICTWLHLTRYCMHDYQRHHRSKYVVLGLRIPIQLLCTIVDEEALIWLAFCGYIWDIYLPRRTGNVWLVAALANQGLHPRCEQNCKVLTSLYVLPSCTIFKCVIIQVRQESYASCENEQYSTSHLSFCIV